MTVLLCVNVGNTHTALGLFAGDELVATRELPTRPELAPAEAWASVEELARHADVAFDSIGGLSLATVVPACEETWVAVAREHLGCPALSVHGGLDTGLAMDVEDPSQVGPDRIANSVGGVACWGRPVLVVDFGTATTFDAVDATGSYRGGAIAPGMGISADALASRTARLPRVPLQAPRTAIGRSTVAAMQSGIFWGYVELASGMIRRLATELGGDPRVVATGGLAALLAPYVAAIDEVAPHLTLVGLHAIHGRLRGRVSG